MPNITNNKRELIPTSSSPAPTKKRMTLDSTTETFDPESLLERTRTDVGKHLMSLASPDRPSLSDDLPYLLRSTNALISTNKEVWERCADKRDYSTDGLFCFSRVSVHKIKCQTIDNHTAISVTVHPQIFCKDFKELPPIPCHLLQLVPAHIPAPASETGNSSSFPDYERYLAHTGCLHDTILVPFLLQLKEHLESLQVFLGEIETFLSESLLHAPFLEDLFGTEITVPNEFESRSLKTTVKKADPEFVRCGKCKERYVATRYLNGTRRLIEVCRGCNDPLIATPNNVKIFDTKPQKLLHHASSLGRLDATIFLASEKDQQNLKLLKEYIVST